MLDPELFTDVEDWDIVFILRKPMFVFRVSDIYLFQGMWIRFAYIYQYILDFVTQSAAFLCEQPDDRRIGSVRRVSCPRDARHEALLQETSISGSA